VLLAEAGVHRDARQAVLVLTVNEQASRQSLLQSTSPELEVKGNAGSSRRASSPGLARCRAMEEQNQIRVATALSEVSRNAVTGRERLTDGSRHQFAIGGAELVVGEAVVGGAARRRPTGIEAAARSMETGTEADGRCANGSCAPRPAGGRTAGCVSESGAVVFCNRGPPWRAAAANQITNQRVDD